MWHSDRNRAVRVCACILGVWTNAKLSFWLLSLPCHANIIIHNIYIPYMIIFILILFCQPDVQFRIWFEETRKEEKKGKSTEAVPNKFLPTIASLDENAWFVFSSKKVKMPFFTTIIKCYNFLAFWGILVHKNWTFQSENILCFVGHDDSYRPTSAQFGTKNISHKAFAFPLI